MMREFSLSLLIIVAWSPQNEAGSVAFGTENGYDVGGTDPICFKSTLPATNETNLDNNFTSIESLNEGLFEKEQKADLLSNCYNGLDLVIEPLGSQDERTDMYQASDRQLFTDTQYKFSLTLSADLTEVSQDILVQALEGTSTIYARLQLCDAIRSGFCNPVVDSRTVEESWSPAATDLEASPGDEFATDETRWKYEPGSTLLGIEEGNLIYSRWIKWTLREISPNSTEFKTSLDVTFQIPRGSVRTGAYFFIAHCVMNFAVGDNLLRIDVAEPIPGNVVEIRDPPKIYMVTNTMKIVLGVVIGLFGANALAMLLFVIIYRNHIVMKLAQGPFLTAIAAACLIQIVCTFTYLPTRDIYCSLSGPLVLVPMTFVGACLVGRIWRVYGALATANSFGRSGRQSRWCDMSACIISTLTLLSTVPCCMKHVAAMRKPANSLRMAIDSKQTATLILILTLPQLILQVSMAVLVENKLDVEFDSGGNIGREVCWGEGHWGLASIIGTAYVCFVYLLTVIIAWISRSLPSAFNEKDQIFHAATISAILAFVSISLTTIMNSPTTNPDVLVFLRAILSIGVATSILVLILLPKIKRICSGETVVMSNLLGSRFGTSATSSSNSTSDTALGVQAAAQRLDESAKKDMTRTTLRSQDPLPPCVETKICDVQNVLGSIVEKLVEGRPLTSAEMRELKSKVRHLHSELTLVDVEDSAAT